MMKWRLFFTKLFHWEYWPMNVVYFPLVLYWLWLSIKARSLFYFSAANPSIETGGMLGESKFDILNKIPQKYVPKTVYIKFPKELADIKDLIREYDFSYPIILKPDIGERGKFVEKINNENELKKYLKLIKVDFLIQEFINFKVELGVFYYRHPDWDKGVVSSVVVKDYLKIKGDGRSTIIQLMQCYPRAAFQLERLSKKNKNRMDDILGKDEILELEPIGNHCRGTTFLNGNHYIDEAFTNVFDQISKQVDGFFYGRYDLKCKSIEDLKRGEHIKIVELNGVGAEPAHIYQPGFSLFKAYKILFSHWKTMYDISSKNHQQGFRYMALKEGWMKLKWLKQYNKALA